MVQAAVDTQESKVARKAEKSEKATVARETEGKPEATAVPVAAESEAAAAAEAKAKADNRFVDLLRKVALASVGAVVLAQEEIEDFVERLIEKGELAEKDGKSLIRDLLDKRRKRTKETVETAEHEIDTTIEKVLHRINMPSKGDVEVLAKKIDELDAKIERLAKK